MLRNRRKCFKKQWYLSVVFGVTEVSKACVLVLFTCLLHLSHQNVEYVAKRVEKAHSIRLHSQMLCRFSPKPFFTQRVSESECLFWRPVRQFAVCARSWSIACVPHRDFRIEMRYAAETQIFFIKNRLYTRKEIWLRGIKAKLKYALYGHRFRYRLILPEPTWSIQQFWLAIRRNIHLRRAAIVFSACRSKSKCEPPFLGFSRIVRESFFYPPVAAPFICHSWEVNFWNVENIRISRRLMAASPVGTYWLVCTNFFCIYCSVWSINIRSTCCFVYMLFHVYFQRFTWSVG